MNNKIVKKAKDVKEEYGKEIKYGFITTLCGIVIFGFGKMYGENNLLNKLIKLGVEERTEKVES